jgi:hypothetical protein
MRIDGPGKSGSVQGNKKKDKASGSSGDTGFQKLVGESDAPASSGASAGASSASQIASLDVLLAVQGAEDPTQGHARKRMRERGDKILNVLETMRMALLNGTMTVGHMISLADTVASHREKITDPMLVNILDEIDLRAQIELAKMARAFEQSEKKTI